MKIVNIHEAKTHLSRLLENVEHGEEVVIARAGKPIVKLVPFAEGSRRRVGGLMRGKVWMSEDFDAPLPEDVQRLFEGEDKPLGGRA
jgi:prevent-host-death family protein